MCHVILQLQFVNVVSDQLLNGTDAPGMCLIMLCVTALVECCNCGLHVSPCCPESFHCFKARLHPPVQYLLQ